MVTGTGSVVAVELALEEEIHAGGRLIERKLCNFPALKAMEVPGTERSGCGRPLRCLDEPHAAGCGCPSSRPELRCPLGPKFRSLLSPPPPRAPLPHQGEEGRREDFGER
ncbi:Os12g0279350 [Oryza sativa Japonica Group]|uniref:Os12g0279350 protein n=1 Tax=Oryza sativa subsp. japonica TaxID=39947 RepID=A0A0P0Y915_ORYSJ|nr:Os12g0279350 [Oryza sativa Japonica Group]